MHYPQLACEISEQASYTCAHTWHLPEQEDEVSRIATEGPEAARYNAASVCLEDLASPVIGRLLLVGRLENALASATKSRGALTYRGPMQC